MKIIQIIFFFLFISATLNTLAQTDSIYKLRLPEEINRYQPSIIPVISPDGKRLYFDRKLHPENIGGIYDSDDIWASELNSYNAWSDAYNIGRPLNTKFADVLFSISPDGETALVYGKNIHNLRKSGFAFASKDSENKWSIKEYLEINNFYNDSSNFYASLSGDGTILLLSLSRKDSYGGLDLYVSFLDSKNNVWSEPKNLGNIINTANSEEAPFLAYDNKTLYFSSNKSGGEGKQDLYFTRRLDDSWNIWSEPVNLGNKINTPFDENSIYLNILSDSAYIVSGDTDSKRKGIYLINVPEKFKPLPYTVLAGKFDFQEMINTKKIKIYFSINGENTKYQNSYSTTSKTDFKFVLPEKDIYSITAECENFEKVTFEIDTRNILKPEYIEHNIKFEKRDSILLGTVLFDFDSFILSDNSKSTLSEIISILKENNTKFILINGYTDTTGTEPYNLNLSKQRAVTVSKYFAKNGIPKNIISLKAYGKSQPKSLTDAENRCVEIILCNPK